MAKVKVNYEHELYKLLTNKQYIFEMGWISDTEFCIWVTYWDLKEFMDEVHKIFGYGIHDDDGFVADMQSDGVCIDVCEMLGNYLSVEDVFPKEKYQH